MADPDPVPPFSPDEARALAAVLDEIVPPAPARGLPGAGELGLVAHLERMLARMPDLRPAIGDALARLDAEARAQGGADFAALPRPARRALLDALRERAPFVLSALVFQTYAGYYQQPRVLEALGVPARPPFPQGYELPPLDPARLDAVRARGRIWRDA